MNDTELDEILDQWSVPPAPTSLRERVRAGFAAGLERKSTPGARLAWLAAFLPSVRKSLFAGAALGILALLLVVTQALPQTPAVRIPYTVDSEFVRYGDDGSGAVEMNSTSYTSQNGNETLLSRSIPGHPFGTVLGHTLDAMLPFWSRLMLPFTISSQELEKIKRSAPRNGVGFITGCADWTCLVIQHYYFRRQAADAGAGCVDGVVVGRETILNYATTAVERRLGDRRRMTLWVAPDLGCFALRITNEELRPDGTFHPITVKQALRVTLNP